MQNITNSENFLSTLEENSQTNIKHFLSPRIIVQQERQLKQDKISKESLQNVTETIQNIESNLRNINRKVDSLQSTNDKHNMNSIEERVTKLEKNQNKRN